VQIYLDDVREVVNRPGKDAVEWRVEERVEFDDECFGTVDCSAYDPREAWLYVWDYKHGAGVRVAAPGNAQLLFYATAAATKLNRPLSGITATIVQPRHLEAASAGVISRVEYDVIDLLEHASAIKTAVAPPLSSTRSQWPGWTSSTSTNFLTKPRSTQWHHRLTTRTLRVPEKCFGSLSL